MECLVFELIVTEAVKRGDAAGIDRHVTLGDLRNSTGLHVLMDMLQRERCSDLDMATALLRFSNLGFLVSVDFSWFKQLYQYNFLSHMSLTLGVLLQLAEDPAAILLPAASDASIVLDDPLRFPSIEKMRAKLVKHSKESFIAVELLQNALIAQSDPFPPQTSSFPADRLPTDILPHILQEIPIEGTMRQAAFD